MRISIQFSKSLRCLPAGQENSQTGAWFLWKKRAWFCQSVKDNSALFLVKSKKHRNVKGVFRPCRNYHGRDAPFVV